MREALDKGAKAEKKWAAMFKKYAAAHPELAKEFTDAAEGRLPVNLGQLVDERGDVADVVHRARGGDPTAVSGVPAQVDAIRVDDEDAALVGAPHRGRHSFHDPVRH